MAYEKYQSTYTSDQLNNMVNFSTNMVADAYDSTKTYNIDDKVIYNFNLYQCSTAITTAEAWNSAHWTQIKVFESDDTIWDGGGSSGLCPTLVVTAPTGSTVTVDGGECCGR